MHRTVASGRQADADSTSTTSVLPLITDVIAVAANEQQPEQYKAFSRDTNQIPSDVACRRIYQTAMTRLLAGSCILKWTGEYPTTTHRFKMIHSQS